MGNRTPKPEAVEAFEKEIWKGLFDICLGADVLDVLYRLKVFWTWARHQYFDDTVRFWFAHLGCELSSIVHPYLFSALN